MAKWIFDDFDEMGRHYHCSKCGYGIMVKENLRDWTPNKCSNCKTEMETRESRAIDAESLKDKLNDVYGDSNNLVYLYAALDLIDAQPTLIPTNEWASVEERLPDTEKEVRLFCVTPYGYKYQCHGFYVPPGMHRDDSDYSWDWECCGQYDEDSGDYFVNPGWYESSHNWDGYSAFEIADKVTHWMPLPAPPDCFPPEGEEDT